MEYKTRKQIRLADYDYSESGYYFVTVCSIHHQDIFGEHKSVGAGLASARKPGHASARKPCHASARKPCHVSALNYNDFTDVSVELSPLGKIIKQQWNNIPDYYDHVKLDEYVIMPNHIHGILIINKNRDEFEKTQMDTLAVIREDMQNTCVDISSMRADASSMRADASSMRADASSMRADARPAPTVSDIICSFKSRCTVEYLRYIKHNNLNVSGNIWQRSFYDHVIRNERALNAIREYIAGNPMNWEKDIENLINL